MLPDSVKNSKSVYASDAFVIVNGLLLKVSNLTYPKFIEFVLNDTANLLEFPLHWSAV